jgi:hypothetical protein
MCPGIALSGEELQYSEPKKNDAESDTRKRNAISSHPGREAEVNVKACGFHLCFSFHNVLLFTLRFLSAHHEIAIRQSGEQSWFKPCDIQTNRTIRNSPS